MREHFVVLSIRSREVARAQRSGVGRCEDALKVLDFGNRLLGVHSVSISNMRVAIVKRSGMDDAEEKTCSPKASSRRQSQHGDNTTSSRYHLV